MDRRRFIKNGCAACLSLAAVPAIFSSCSGSKYIAGKLAEDGLLVSADEFRVVRNGRDSYRSSVIIRNEALQYPIVIYRFSETDYSALWMRCSHQGAELQVSGDFLQCSAHGSEFDKRGKVTNGPANNDLRVFPVTVNKNELFIDLRKR